MTDYRVAHRWEYPDGRVVARVIEGSLPDLSLAYYVADLITTATGQPSSVYAVDPDTGSLIPTPRPETPTSDASTYPAIRVEPSGTPGDPPDILAGGADSGPVPVDLPATK